MNLYSTGILIAATVYIKAENEAQALEKLKAASYTEALVQDFTFEGDIISERQFDNPRLPDVSLSPVMTCMGLQGDDGNMTKLAEFSLAAEDVPEVISEG